MSRLGGLNLVLAVVVVAVLGLGLTWSPERSQRNFELLPQMVEAVPAESYAASSILPGGAAMQLPPEGTVPRDLLPLGLAATEEDAVRAGLELSNPLSAEDPNATTRGAEIFRVYCSLCHGNGGLGDGTVAQRGFPAPPSLLAEHARSLPDGRIFHIVTFGQGNMPAHASQLERRDRWAAVLRVRALQAASPAEPVSSVGEADLAALPTPPEPAAPGEEGV